MKTVYNFFKKSFARNVLKPTETKLGSFNKSTSKYKLNSEYTQEEIVNTQNSIPPFLKKQFNNTAYNDGQTILKNTINYRKVIKPLKSGKRLILKKKEFTKKPKKEHIIKEKREQRNALFEQKNWSLLSKEDKKSLRNNNWSINRHSKEFIQIEKERMKNELAQIKKEKRVKVIEKEDFEETERLSKRLARMGITSRRYAETLIQKGVVKVDGIIVRTNVPVNFKNDIRVNDESILPVKESIKLWVFNKPQGFVCVRKDSRNRPNIFDFLKTFYRDSKDHRAFLNQRFIPVGNLDFYSEGLLLLTNNGDLASALEKNKELERSYKIRVFGRMFSEFHLNKIRKGVIVKDRKVSFHCQLIRKQTTNTWLHLKSFDNSIINIRLLFQKLSLRVNRLIRVRYGSFTLGNSNEPGKLNEVEIPEDVGEFLKERLQYKLNTKQEKVDKIMIQNNTKQEEFEKKVIRLGESKLKKKVKLIK